MDKKPYYITTAIAYASRKPHIGNTYEAIMTDAVARYKRACGYDVRFLTGTDEHGQKVEDCAKQAGVSPKQYVDGIAGEIKKLWDRMNVSYDRFIRTTDADHEAAVQKMFKKFYEQGDIYLSEYEGWYCEPDETFYTQTQIVKDAEGNTVCPECGRPLKKVKEQAYFFAMSKYADRLMKHIEENPDFIVPVSRKREMINNFLKPGLQDLCVSRSSFKWGIPVDFAPGHVVYVWLDALSNYITGLGYSPDSGSELFDKYWPADVHVIGKDILRFHTIYWPIFLMALGLPLPKQIFGHPWLLMNGSKMSKSVGNVLYADDLADIFGVDAVRYYVLAEMPYANDGNITWEDVATRYNGDLANIFGNLVSRTIAMTGKYFDGVIPAPDGDSQEVDDELKAAAKTAFEGFCSQMDNLHLADAADAVIELVRCANRYIDKTLPWVLAKDEASRPRLGTVLYNLLESIRISAVLLASFMPDSCAEILRRLGTSETGLDTAKTFGMLKAGVTLGSAEPLFARIDSEKLAAAIEKVNAKNAPKPEKPPVPTVTIDEFAKVEMTVCKVLSCEKVEKSEKLLSFMLDDGSGETRHILSGIAKYYSPEQLVGKTVVACTNLPPRKMMGTESNGMLLSAEKDGSLNLLMLDDAIPAGAKLC